MALEHFIHTGLHVIRDGHKKTYSKACPQFEAIDPTLAHINCQFTGGESALIGGGGSVLGVGTDIAGSVRVPANYCGIASLKPTARRVSKRGTFSGLPGVVGSNYICTILRDKLI